MAGHRRLETVSVTGGPVLASSGLAIGPTTAVADADFGVDTLIAVGGPGQRAAAYVQAARVEAARRLLETTDTPLDGVARACGFGTVETLHRSFHRQVRVSPGRYRQHFAGKVP